MIDPKDELARYARTGSDVAFRRLVDHYGSLVLHSARRRVRDPGLAEEVAQNVFALLAKKATKVSQYDSTSAWLYETTRRESAKALRGQLRHQRRVEALANEAPTPAMSDDHARELRDLLPQLEEALDSLKPPERQVLLARFFDDQSFREIATTIGKTESACKMRLSRALEKLNLKLRSRGITFSAITLGTLLQTEWAKAAPTSTLTTLANNTPHTTSQILSSKIVLAMNNQKFLILLAMALLVLVAAPVAIKTASKPDKVQLSNSTITSPQPSLLSDQSQPRQLSKRRSQNTPWVMTHQFEELQDFYLPDKIIENVTLSEAMEQLLVEYQKVCEDTKEGTLAINYHLEGQALPISRINLGGSFLSTCHLLAAFTGTSLKIEEQQLTFSEIPDGPTTTRRWTVPPTFIEYLDGLNLATQAKPEPSDPFAETPPDKNKKSPRELLQNIGFSFEEGETISHLPSSSTLIARANNRLTTVIESLVNRSIENTPIQIRIKVLTSLNESVEELPSVMARSGQNATIEIGTEYLETKDDQELLEAFVGVRLQIEPELYGLGERTKLTYSYIEKPAEENLAQYRRSGRLDDLNLEQFQIKDATTLKTATERLENTPEKFQYTDRDGDVLSLRFTTERIDATGRPIK